MEQTDEYGTTTGRVPDMDSIPEVNKGIIARFAEMEVTPGPNSLPPQETP